MGTLKLVASFWPLTCAKQFKRTATTTDAKQRIGGVGDEIVAITPLEQATSTSHHHSFSFLDS